MKLIVKGLKCWFVALFITACSTKRVSYFASVDQIPISKFNSKAQCDSYQSYITEANTDVTYKLNTIFHIIEGPIGQANFSPDKIKEYFWLLTENANMQLLRNEAMKLPLSNSTPVISSMIQYHILPDGYRHVLERDKEVAYFMNKGSGQNNYTTDIIDRYAVNKDSVFNVFVMAFPPDQLEQRGQDLHGSGIALGSSVKICGLYQKGGPFWLYSTLLNHEMGHVLSLSHAWHEDGCDDTPNHPNCYEDNAGECVGTKTSNNMMDYNNSQQAMTPCQIGRMRMMLAREDNFQRKLLKFDFCKNKDNLSLEIRKKHEWLGEKDLDKNIVIKKGGELRVCCRLSLPENGYIYVEKGGQLILDNVKLHNACGYAIKGILAAKGSKVIRY